MAQRLRMREALASRGCDCSFACASARASGEVLGLRMSSFNCARLAAYFFTILARRFSRSTMFVFAICKLLPEREVECLEQCSALTVVPSGRRDRDVHASQLIDLVVLDLGKNDLLLDPQTVVALPVERTRRNAAN